MLAPPRSEWINSQGCQCFGLQQILPKEKLKKSPDTLQRSQTTPPISSLCQQIVLMSTWEAPDAPDHGTLPKANARHFTSSELLGFKVWDFLVVWVFMFCCVRLLNKNSPTVHTVYGSAMLWWLTPTDSSLRGVKACFAVPQFPTYWSKQHATLSLQTSSLHSTPLKN